ncbi:MAG: ATP-binding protein [Clostridiales bacterium]|jgi:sensor histidine kinase regulating citrate/malate metabolism|nr:ATP-binding protein [Eubacteriales bacterium]MDH7567123.1 ATP-binding protein [Clostridiales bacterium]
MMGFFLICSNYATSSGKSIVLYNILLFVIYLLYIALAFFDLKERSRLVGLQNKLKLYEEDVKNLEGIINIIRREKHDFLNHINTVFALTKLNKPDSLERIGAYLQKLTNNLQSSYKFYNTGNDFVDGLLAIKSNTCYENNIELIVDIEDELTYADVDESDLPTIIGNILNNAIEAVMSEPGSHRYIAINTYVEEDNYYISIANNGPAIPEKILDTIFENGFTTKQNNSIDHGYGLFITMQYVKRNGGRITVESTDERTEFLIEFKAVKNADGEAGTDDSAADTAG